MQFLVYLQLSVQLLPISPSIHWDAKSLPLAAIICETLLDQWQQLKQTDLKALNEQLARKHLALLDLNTGKIDHDVEDQIEMGDEN